MSKFASSKFFSFQRLTGIFGGFLLIIFGGLYFFNVSAQTKTAEAFNDLDTQNLANRRLVYTSTTFSFQSFPGSVSGIYRDF